MRRKIVVDIKRRKQTFHRTLPQVNLAYARTIRIPVKRVASVFFILFFAVSYVFNFVNAPTSGDALAAVDRLEDRKALEAQLADLEKEMDILDKQRTAEYKKGNTLQSEITRMNNQIAKLKLQIKSIMLTLKKVNREIDSTSTQIGVTESKIDEKRRIIGDIIRDIDRNENQGVLLTLLANNNLSSFFTDLSNLGSISDQLKINLDELIGLHTELGNQKESLAVQKTDIETLRAYQEAQSREIQQTKAEKDQLLRVTKNKESEYKKLLAEKQKTAAQIRSRIFDLIGGGQMSFGDAYKFAKVAESATGVRAALLLAVLDGESALGKNVGKCNYQSAMHPTRDIPIFLDITKRLGMDPDTTLVSCAIRSDGAYGGAMGPSQFIPSTWVRYEAQIASMTGHNPPSPWNSQDAFMATALYMKNAGAASGSLYQEKVAAARYYAGGRWANYLSSYGARVINKAAQFEQDIATLIS